MNRNLRFLLREHLEKVVIFGELAHHRSLRGASRALRIGQPGLTRLVRTLEDVVGVPLLMRSRDGISTTPAGATLRDLAMSLEKALDDTVAEFSVDGAPRFIDVRFGAYVSVAAQLGSLFKRLARERPQWTFRITTGRSSALVDAVARGELELAFVATPNVRSPLRAVPIFSDMFAFFAVPGRRADWLDAASIITVPDALDRTGESIGKHLDRLGFGSRVRLATDSFDLVRTYVEEGLGIGVLPMRVAAPAVARNALCRLAKPFPPGFGPHRTFLVHKEARGQHHGLDAVLRELVSAVAEPERPQGARRR